MIILITRIFSGVFLVLLLVPLIIAGGRPFSIAVGILAILGLKEFLDLKKEEHKFPYGIQLFSICMLLFLIFYEFELHGTGISYTLLSLLSLCFLLPTLLPYKNKVYQTNDAFYLLGVLCFLSVSFHSFIVFREKNLALLGYLVMIPVITDIFAYFIGKFIGRRKIAPTISPNKTLAGSVGGTLCGTIIPTIYFYFFVFHKEIYLILGMSFLLSIIGQLGDLLFSKIKREHGVKDFSDLIPGHGGVLDRFDSLLFVILAFLIIERFF